MGDAVATAPGEPADRQRTLASPVELRGVGIHTGAPSRAVLRPAPADAGVWFGIDGVRIPAEAAHVAEASRCTVLEAGGARVATVEHVLSALFGLGVDNAQIDVEGPELPILDGSAAPWADAILSAGVAVLPAKPRCVRLDAPVVLHEGETWLVATPADSLRVTCVTCYDHALLGTTAAAFSGTPDSYRSEVAPARTYWFEAEVAALRAAGLGLGGSLDNALIIHTDRFSSPLRLPAEWTRHKLLDLLGDLALVGRRLAACVTAIRPGHRTNAAFAALIAGSASRERA